MSDINELLPTRPGVKQLLQARLIPWMHALLLPLLILWTSFVFYLHKQLFSFLGLPAFIGFGGMLFVAFLIAILAMAHAGVLYRLVIVGLITFFIDVEFQTFMHLSKYSLLAIFAGLVVLFQKLQKDFYWITAAVFATCLVSTVVAPSANRGEAGIRYSEAAARAADPSLPRIVHLILDEHIGVEGIPTGIESGQAIKDRILRFYKQSGFYLYGNAFSHYSSTYNAIPNLLNFSTEAKHLVLVTDSSPYKLRRNIYFERLLQKQYRINVFESDWLDFCADTTLIFETCREYDSLTLGAISNMSIPVSEQLQVIAAGYLQQSQAYRRARYYYRSVQPSFVSRGIPLPAWNWDSITFYPEPVNAMSALPDLWADILKMPPGKVMFAHLLLPHFTYVYQEDCSTHGSLQAMKNGNLTLDAKSSRDIVLEGKVQIDGYDNTRESREESYRLYFQQLECLYMRLGELFQRMQSAGIFDSSIIIVHGDHGSRISRHEPYVQNLLVMSKEDYSDAYSTLFAVKLPGKAGGYDLSIRALEDLLAEAIKMPGDSGPAPESMESGQFVYLESDAKGDLVRVPYPISP